MAEDATEESRALLRQEKRDAETQVIRGLTQLAMSVPIVIAGGLLAILLGGPASVIVSLVMVALSTAAIAGGSYKMIRGARDIRRAAHELRALDLPAALPPARIVDR